MVTLGRGHRRNQTPPQESNCHLLFLNNSLGSPEAKWKTGAHLLISLASFTASLRWSVHAHIGAGFSGKNRWMFSSSLHTLEENSTPEREPQASVLSELGGDSWWGSSSNHSFLFSEPRI